MRRASEDRGAEAAEARRREIDDEAFVYAEQVEVLKAECEALRKVDDAMVERAARATMNRVAEEDDLFADDEEALRIHREYARIALTAAVSALAVRSPMPAAQLTMMVMASSLSWLIARSTRKRVPLLSTA